MDGVTTYKQPNLKYIRTAVDLMTTNHFAHVLTLENIFVHTNTLTLADTSIHHVQDSSGFRRDR